MRLRGFTLIELLIVVAVLGVLSSLILINFPGVSRSARDAQRREELQQYRVALEVYANKNNGIYVDHDASAIRPRTMCGTGASYPLGPISCTEDPKNGSNVCNNGATTQTCRYSYQSSGAGTNYILWAPLEKPVDTAKPCFVICSQGLSGESTCPALGASPSCPLL